jgi:cobalt-zinc-cadmium efflux system protein
MIWVATLGIVVNAATALMFVKGRNNDLNIRGAFLHMIADAVISAGVVLAGVMIWLTGIKLIDPMVGVIIAVAIFFSAWALLRESIRLTMDAVPENIDPKAVTDYFLGLPAVQDVHHLHVWGLSTTESALTAHLVLSKPSLDNGLLKRIQQELHDHYHIAHATIQFESHENDLCLTKRCSLHFDGGKKKRNKSLIKIQPRG